MYLHGLVLFEASLFAGLGQTRKKCSLKKMQPFRRTLLYVLGDVTKVQHTHIHVYIVGKTHLRNRIIKKGSESNHVCCPRLNLNHERAKLLKHFWTSAWC